MSDGTPVWPLLTTVFEVRHDFLLCCANSHLGSILQSILEVFILCVAGYILARKGILDRPTQKVSSISFRSGSY